MHRCTLYIEVESIIKTLIRNRNQIRFHCDANGEYVLKTFTTHDNNQQIEHSFALFSAPY